MFSPRYNQPEDLDEYERMRQQALTYNPEMGDTGASAPRADTAYNPEMGDTGANAPRGQSSDEAIDAAYAQDPGAFETERAPTPAVGSHLWMRPGLGLYNPEEGDLASNAPVAPAMSADEAGRRLPAPPPAFTPQEAQAQLAPMPYSGPLQRPVAPPSRVAQAAQPMQQPVSRTLQRPQSAASEQYDPGQAPPSALATFIRSLPGNIANIASAASSSKHRASPYALQGIQQRNAENDQAFAQDEQARQAFGVRKQQLARLKSQDEIQAQRAQAMAKRQGVADTRAATEFQQGQQDRQWSLEARDPNSQKSQLFRQAVEQAHPELKAAIGEAQWAQLSPANAAMIAPLIEKGQAEAAAKGKESARIQGLADKKELLKYKQDIKKPTINVGMRMSGDPEKDRVTAENALKAAYGGQIPADVQGRVDLVQSMPRKQQGSAYQQILSQSADDRRADVAAAGKKGGQGVEQGFEVADPVAHDKANSDPGSRRAMRSVMSNGPMMDKALDRMEQIRKETGTEVLPTKLKGEYDVLHSRVIGALTDLNHSGVLNPSEFERYTKMLPNLDPGISDAARLVGMGDPTVESIKGFRGAMKTLSQNELGGYGLRHTGKTVGEQEIEKTQGGDTPQAAAAPGGTTRLVRNGKPYDIPNDKVDAALKAGFQRGG